MKTYNFPNDKKNFEFNYIYGPYEEIHNHRYYELTITTKGSFIHHINGINKVVNEDTLLLIRPTDCHSFKVYNKKENFELFNFMISTNYFTSFFNLTNKDILTKIKESEYIEIPISKTSSKYFSNFINKTSTTYRKNDYPEEILTPLFIDLISIIFHYYQNPIQTKNYSIVVNHMMELMQDKNNFVLTIEDIAKKANYSYAHVNRLFKKETGSTISKYFNDVKLDYAKRMIETKDDPIYDIALDVGFTSLSHFTKIFYKYYGNTPAKYRKIWNSVNY